MQLLGRLEPFAMSYIVGREDKGTNNGTMLPTAKNNAAAGYQGPVKIELLKGAGLLNCSYQQRKWSKRYSAAATLTLNNRQETLRHFGRACHCVYFGSRIRSSPRMYRSLEAAYHQGRSILPCNARLLMLYF